MFTFPSCLQDELLSKKKKERKKKLSSKPAEELRCIGQDRYTCDIITELHLSLALFEFIVMCLL